MSTLRYLSARHLAYWLAAASLWAGFALVAPGCAPLDNAAPRCGDSQRLGLVAQSVPTASYVPCVVSLPVGWSSRVAVVRNGETQFSLLSDRAEGHAVQVRLTRWCSARKAVPVAARVPGVRSYLHLASIDPRYAGTAYDEFSGGCVTYSFDFERGPHIALVQEFQAAVSLVPRHELALRLRDQLGLELGP